mgnify:CR=1 FL=1
MGREKVTAVVEPVVVHCCESQYKGDRSTVRVTVESSCVGSAMFISKDVTPLETVSFNNTTHGAETLNRINKLLVKCTAKKEIQLKKRAKRGSEKRKVEEKEKKRKDERARNERWKREKKKENHT